MGKVRKPTEESLHNALVSSFKAHEKKPGGVSQFTKTSHKCFAQATLTRVQAVLNLYAWEARRIKMARPDITLPELRNEALLKAGIAPCTLECQ
jgi:hypothetical protein